MTTSILCRLTGITKVPAKDHERVPVLRPGRCCAILHDARGTSRISHVSDQVEGSLDRLMPHSEGGPTRGRIWQLLRKRKCPSSNHVYPNEVRAATSLGFLLRGKVKRTQHDGKRHSRSGISAAGLYRTVIPPSHARTFQRLISQWSCRCLRHSYSLRRSVRKQGMRWS